MRQLRLQQWMLWESQTYFASLWLYKKLGVRNRDKQILKPLM